MGLDRANLFGREVHHANHLLTHQAFSVVEVGNLRARFEYTDIGTKIHMQNVGRETGLREHFGGDNGANPQIHLLKILPRNRFHTAFPAMMPH